LSSPLDGARDRRTLLQGQMRAGRVCVHKAVDKADDVVFRCTLDESQAERWLEVPACMFDRMACADAEPLTAQPFVSIDAVCTENLSSGVVVVKFAKDGV